MPRRPAAWISIGDLGKPGNRGASGCFPAAISGSSVTGFGRFEPVGGAPELQDLSGSVTSAIVVAVLAGSPIAKTS
jgi:hypothetical protein